MNIKRFMALAYAALLVSCGGGASPPGGQGEPPPIVPPATVAFNMDAAYATALSAGVSFAWTSDSAGSPQQLSFSYEPTTDGQLLGQVTRRSVRRLSSRMSAQGPVVPLDTVVSYTLGPTAIAGMLDEDGLPTAFTEVTSLPTAAAVGQAGAYARAISYADVAGQQVRSQMLVGWSVEAADTGNAAWACLSFTPVGGALQEKQCLRIDPGGAILGAKIERHTGSGTTLFVADPPDTAAPVPYTLLPAASSLSATATGPVFATIGDQGAWAAFWAARGLPTPTLSLDWSHQRVVVGTAGARPDSCWRLDLVSVYEWSDRITLRYQDAKDGSMACALAVQTPFLLAAIPASDKPVEWVATQPDAAVFARPSLYVSGVTAWYERTDTSACRLLHVEATLTASPPQPVSASDLSLRALTVLTADGVPVVSQWSALSVSAGTSTYQVSAAGCPTPPEYSGPQSPEFTVAFKAIERQFPGPWVTPQWLVCRTPAPLYGASGFGYIVVYKDGVEPVAETARLAALYGFQPTFVWTAALDGFAASFSDDVLARLRCEPTVKYVEYDQIVNIE